MRRRVRKSTTLVLTGLLHSLLTVIASEAKQSPSAKLGVTSSLPLLATTDTATTLLVLRSDLLGVWWYNGTAGLQQEEDIGNGTAHSGGG
jgi:hypothetical protein